jgi:serine/threonine protein kinase
MPSNNQADLSRHRKEEENNRSIIECTDVLKDHLQVNPSIEFAENEEENNNQFYHDQTDHLIEEEWENPSFLVKDLDTGQSYNVEEVEQHFSLITLDSVVAQHKQTSSHFQQEHLFEKSDGEVTSNSSFLLSMYTSDETADIEIEDDSPEEASRVRSESISIVDEAPIEPIHCKYTGCTSTHQRVSGYCIHHEVIAKEEEDARAQALYLIPMGARAEFVKMNGHGFVYDTAHRLYTVYAMEMRCLQSGSTWVIYRRYQEFKALNDCLRPMGIRVPILPPKKILGSFEAEFLAKRQIELAKWLRSFLNYDRVDESAKNPHLVEEVRKFLTLRADQPPLFVEKLNFGRTTLFGGNTYDTDLFLHNDHSLVCCGKCTCNTAGLYGIHRKSNSDNNSNSNSTRCSFSFSSSSSSSNSCHRATLSDFQMIQVIGRGSFGKVVLVGHQVTKKLYAMKILSKENIVKRKQVEHTRTERRVLGYTRHPFIVGLHWAFQTPQRLYFILDYCPGGELFYHLSRMKKLPEHMACFYAAEITLALEHLHGLGVVYRDLKPENILLTKDGHIKLADFGLAKEGIRDGEKGTNSLCGTPEYLPPEILDRLGHGTAVDWWNLGMVLYEMLTGLPPWYTNDRKKLFERLRSARLHFPPYVSRRAEALIRQLLNRNPSERLGSKGAFQVKNHLFFENIDWIKLSRKQMIPPFRPCHSAMSDGDAAPLNFEAEFTRLPLPSMEKNDQMTNGHGFSKNINISAATNRFVRTDSETFQGFTYENPSLLDSLSRDD